MDMLHSLASSLFLRCLNICVPGGVWHILLVPILFATVFVVLDDVWGEMFFVAVFVERSILCKA